MTNAKEQKETGYDVELIAVPYGTELISDLQLAECPCCNELLFYEIRKKGIDYDDGDWNLYREMVKLSCDDETQANLLGIIDSFEKSKIKPKNTSISTTIAVQSMMNVLNRNQGNTKMG